MSTALLIILILLLVGVGGGPVWGWHSMGAWPSGSLGLLLLILIIVALTRRLN